MEVVQNELANLAMNLLPLVLTLVTAVAGVLIANISAWAKKETQKVTDENQRNLINGVIDDVARLAGLTVKAIEQTTASTLREAVRDGKVDREELVELGTKAVNELKSSLTPEAKKVITDNFGDLEAYLKKEIESSLHDLKQGQNFINIG